MATSTKRKDGAPETNGNNVKPSKMASLEAKEKEKAERESLVLWKKPITTTEYFLRESLALLYTYGMK